MSQLIGKKVVLTLKRSTICTVPKHRAFVQTLGLKKIGDHPGVRIHAECARNGQAHSLSHRRHGEGVSHEAQRTQARRGRHQEPQARGSRQGLRHGQDRRLAAKRARSPAGATVPSAVSRAARCPCIRRLPKRGFTNIFAPMTQEVGLTFISIHFKDGDTVCLEALRDKKLVEFQDREDRGPGLRRTHLQGHRGRRPHHQGRPRSDPGQGRHHPGTLPEVGRVEASLDESTPPAVLEPGTSQAPALHAGHAGDLPARRACFACPE